MAERIRFLLTALGVLTSIPGSGDFFFQVLISHLMFLHSCYKNLSFIKIQLLIFFISFSKHALNPRRAFVASYFFYWIEICIAVIYGKMFCLQIHFSNCNSDFDIEPLLVNSELTIRSVIIYRDKRCFRQLACLYLICNCHS